MTAAERRCERTDLPASMCAHCRGHLDPAAPADLGTGDLLSSFPARYDGRCDNCDGPIREGDTIAALVDGSGYACTRCLP